MLDSRNASSRVLELVVKDHGPAVWLDAKVGEGILRDLMPGLPRERRALVVGVLVGYPAKSLSAANPTVQRFVEIHAIKQMSEEHLLSEDDAQWVVDTWNKALAGHLRPSTKQAKSPYVPGRAAQQEGAQEPSAPPKGHVFPPPPAKSPKSAVPVVLLTVVGTAILFVSLLAIRHFVIGG